NTAPESFGNRHHQGGRDEDEAGELPVQIKQISEHGQGTDGLTNDVGKKRQSLLDQHDIVGRLAHKSPRGIFGVKLESHSREFRLQVVSNVNSDNLPSITQKEHVKE